MDVASSSSSPPVDIRPREKYDVFISFRGEDTRDTFTGHLHAALCGKKVETYIDYKLEKGDNIGPALLEAIEKSKLSVIIFSKNYVSSTWCLDELVHILECQERHGQIAIPIFYGIDPSDVRKQKGSYADAFAQLEERFKDKKDKVDKWRAAVEEATGISGFDNSNKTGTDADFVAKVVEDILAKLNRKSSCDLKGLVGIEKKIGQIESLLCIDSLDVCRVCIWGMGGIGKTTLADAVFHRLSSKFDRCCFLPNVREQETKGGLYELRNQLLREILHDESIDIKTPSIGSNFVLERLLRAKALIVLDDVNNSSQLEFLAGDRVRFGRGSRIIITTRDRGLLEGKVDNYKIYEVERLSSDEALQLFHLHGLKNKPLTTDYTELSRKVVDYVMGIPLAVRTLSPLFLRHKRIEDWEEEFNRLKTFPSEKIQSVYRLSYNGLEKDEKEIFLDIACFLRGKDIDYAKRIIDTRGFFLVGIQGLIEKSLISISTSNCLEMHDLLQEMGRTIAREQCSEEPGKRNRLYNAEDVYHVLETDNETPMVQFISFDLSEIRDPHMSFAGLKKMSNLRFLWIKERSPYYYQSKGVEKLHLSQGLESLPNALRCLDWEAYPWESLPSKFSPKNLVELRMPCSNVEGQLWNKNQNLGNLKLIDLSYCEHLTEVPDLSQSPKIEHIELSNCPNLVHIPSYFKYLDKLTYLGLGVCMSLEYLPEMPCNIEFLVLAGSGIKELASSVWSHEKISSLDITSCKSLEKLPSSSCKLKISGTFSLKDCSSFAKFSELPRYISELDLSGTAIEVLPMSAMQVLISLTSIKLIQCTSLVSLPASICKLKSLERLDLTGCWRFLYFPEILEPMENLKILNLDGTMVKDLPLSIVNLIGLQTLNLSHCCILEAVPDSICNLTHLKTVNFCSSRGLGRTSRFEILDGLVCLTALRDLDLSGTHIECIPASIKHASQLSRLCLIGCHKLQSLPELPLMLSNLEAHGCTSLKTVSSSRTALTRCSDEYKYLQGFPAQLLFYNCLELDQNSWSNIMADAELRIMRVATLSLQPQQENSARDPLVTIVCPGNKIPSWFRYKNYDGSSVNIKLHSDWFREGFLGFALCVVATTDQHILYSHLRIGCKYNFKTNNGESHEIEYPFSSPFSYGKSFIGLGMDPFHLKSRYVFVWYNPALELLAGANSKCSVAFYKLVTEASVEFFNVGKWSCSKIEKCGLSFLYAEDAEIIKLGDANSRKRKFDVQGQQCLQ